MSDPFRDKVVWITGASSGIGESLVYAFEKAGARVVLSARNEDKLHTVLSKCDSPKMHSVYPLDVKNHDGMRKAIANVTNQNGYVDILVNNAGISQRSLIEETSLDVDKEIFDVNYFGTVAITKAVLPYMIKRKTGRVVVISSLAGKLSTPYRSAYSASKHALHGWFDALRAEVSDRNIDVNIICPGYIRTDISINALNAEGHKYNSMDANQDAGMDPKILAAQIIAAIRANKNEVYLGGKETKNILWRNLFPSIYYKKIAEMKRNAST